MKNFSIVIPVYNEDKHIKGLLESIFQINYPADKFEVIVVNDASTDNTVETINKFPEVQLIELKRNVGRYAARKIGAEAAEHPHILFIDSRVVVDSNILAVLNQSSEKIIVGTSLGVEKPGLFDTFYKAVRRIVFRRYYALAANPIRLTKDNFDSFPKGTTVLYVEKKTLFRAFEALNNVDMGKDSSDDTKLINTIVQFTDAIIHPDVKITGLSRTSFRASFLHLIGRGTKFADYYLDSAKRNFWLVIVFPLLALLVMLLSSILVPVPGIVKLTTLLGFDLIVTLFLAKTWYEFVVILFMLPLCVSAFYTGIIYGIYLKCYQAFKAK